MNVLRSRVQRLLFLHFADARRPGHADVFRVAEVGDDARLASIDGHLRGRARRLHLEVRILFGQRQIEHGRRDRRNPELDAALAGLCLHAYGHAELELVASRTREERTVVSIATDEERRRGVVASFRRIVGRSNDRRLDSGTWHFETEHAPPLGFERLDLITHVKSHEVAGHFADVATT